MADPVPPRAEPPRAWRRFLASLVASFQHWYPAAGRRAELGQRGEREARAFLRAKGYRMLGANVRVPMGEADLVCESPDSSTVVIVEVKTRRRGQSERAESIAPEASITAAKRAKLARIARYLVAYNAWHDRRTRIDAVSVEFPAGDHAPLIRHIEGIA